MSDALKVWDLQKSIYRQLKKRARSFETEISDELKSYERNQRKYANREYKVSDFNILTNAIESSHIVYLGDFHSFDQNTRNLERLTRSLIKQKKKFCIGVEMVHVEHQEAITAYLNHKITEIEFLEEIQYHESWRFPWVFYRPFFEMARTHSLSILALNSEGNLIERDQRAALIIGDFLEKNPDERMLVLFGELHIVPNKLPKMVKSRLQGKLSSFQSTIIHQNLDEVYWKLHELNIEKHNQIVEFSDREFSLQTAPPWIKYESMIYWYENLSDDPEFEIHDYVLNDGILGLHSNVPENFIYLAGKIKGALSLDINEEELEDFNIYEHQNLSIILDKIGRLPKANLSNFLKRLVKEGRVFRIPFSNNYYCSSYSINRMSFLAGLHIQDIIVRKKNINYEGIWMESKLVNKFILILKQNAMGYLASKVINPFRKCDLYLDFKEKTLETSLTPDATKKVYETAMRIIESDGSEGMRNLFESNSLTHAYETARRLGFYFGEVLYENFLVKGSPHYKVILDYLLYDNLDEESFYEILKLILPEKEYQLHKKRFF